ncbi:Asp23/Gls24 family envelope stress response protein [Streptococcus sp. DD12]|uniref:Asp23/Gls24 family envelope stress response protein n=1 Tax=Streptococcus sp. DD12 TaxID=1777880 RepID=UPI00079858FD|nr:Asp23/Gls24 family envelope stress response protein [Streptococcus sp. DD12]KXT75316.1 putative alkaline-shock protein [Streptococcus sp. DD12]
MTVKINTQDGQIELSDDVIATVVGGAATQIFGVVGMASKSAVKDNIQALLRRENYAKGVVVRASEEDGISVDVYTVMSYGVKISEVSKNIQERVKFNLENQLGIAADTVNVYVQNIRVMGEKA